MAARACEICTNAYNLADRKLKFLECGDMLEEKYEAEGRIECPKCQQLQYKAIEEFPNNQAMVSVLQTFEIRCHEHPDIVAEERKLFIIL